MALLQVIENIFNPKTCKKRLGQVVFLSFFCLFVMVLAVSEKKMSHVDEFYSYALANSGFMGKNHPEIFEKSLHWYAYNAIETSISKKTGGINDERLLKSLKEAGIIGGKDGENFKNDLERYAYDVLRLGHGSASDAARHIIWDTPLMFFMFDGEKTSLSPKEIKDIMMPKEEAKFNFASVFWNQSFDAHPPLYYMLLNIICSVFYNDGEFSTWHALSINLLFFFLTLPLVYYMMFVVSDANHGLSVFAMVMYAFFAGALVAFLRMYAMLGFFTALYTILILPYFKGTVSKLNNCLLFVVIVLGSLTHHYFLVYLAITGLLLSLRLLYCRQNKLFFKYAAVSGFSVIISLLIFPFTIIHIFFGEHGAVDILYRLSTIEGIEGYLSLIFQYFGFVFRGVLGLMALLAAAILFFKKFDKKIFPTEIFFFLFTIVLYVVFVATTAKYQDERYVSNLWPIAVVFVSYLFYALYKAFSFKAKFIWAIILLIVAAGDFGGHISKYLYLNANARYNILETYKNYPCVYVYDGKNRSFTSQIGSLTLIKELGLYSRVDFAEYGELDKILANREEKSTVIYFCPFQNNVENKGDFENLLKKASYDYNEITSESGYPVYEIKFGR